MIDWNYSDIRLQGIVRSLQSSSTLILVPEPYQPLIPIPDEDLAPAGSVPVEA